LKPVACIVACKWPEADETALFRMADRWEKAAVVLDKVDEYGEKVVNALLGRIEGDTHDDAIDEFWKLSARI
jgi:hypothetical protein